VNVKSLLDIEGLVLNGFVTDMRLEDCKSSKVRSSRLVARLIDGSEVVSDCYDYSRISRIYLIFIKYSEKKWVSSVSASNMMNGITYDR